MNETLEEMVNRIKAENERFREALKFYAAESTYELTGEKCYIGHGDYEESTWYEIDRDKGEVARQTLEGVEND